MSRLVIGALVYDYQVVDVFGPLDLFSGCDATFADMGKVYAPVPDSLVGQFPKVEFHHIGAENLEPVKLTAGALLQPTATVDDCPELDVLILGGPFPHVFALHPKFKDFIQKHVAAGKTLMTNCTGSYVASLAGVLDGRKATINHMVYGWVRHHQPQVKWTDETKWVVDKDAKTGGEIWTAAGAVAGMDMTAHWIKEKYGYDVMAAATGGLDHEPRDVNGVQNVIPKRYGGPDGKQQISTHQFMYHESY